MSPSTVSLSKGGARPYWSVPRIWEGKTAFILAGGFTASGQVHKLQGHRLIAINSSWTVAPFAEFAFFADQRWWNQFGDDLRTYTGTAVTTAPNCTDPRVRVLRRDKPPLISADALGVPLSRTSLTGATVLAAKLGAAKIVWVGADGRLGEKGQRHNHAAAYPWGFKPDSFEKQKQELQSMVPALAAMGVQVVNASPGSFFDMFPAADLDECLADDAPAIGAPVSGRTRVWERSGAALERFVAQAPATVLDIGAGGGEYAVAMREAGLAVTTLDLGHPADIAGNYMDTPFAAPFDGLWASHVLEHQPDAGAFLRKMRQDVKPGGLVCITVPPAKPKIVGGHLTLWNAGLLLYNLILAGFDCSQARVGTYGYNISVLVRRVDAVLPQLRYDKGDIESLAPFFPLPVRQGFDGQLPNIGW